MVKVFVAMNESGILLYVVTYKTKAKRKFVHRWIVIRGITHWRR